MDVHDELFIVGIGASAGGIEALEGLFRPMPADSGIAFVIVAHLAPNKISMLDEIVGRFTAMPVAQAQDDTKVEPNHVYVIAPENLLTLEHGRLRAQSLPRPGRAHNPIDHFFASLASDRKGHAIGIVVSGGGSDGTLGVKAIKEAGGLTLAQGSDHSAPQHRSMPASAIASGLVDLVLPVEAMAEKLVGYVRSFVPTARLVSVFPGATAAERAAAARRAICDILRTRVGHDFDGYKEKTFLRRVQRRMQVLQLSDLGAYIEYLRSDAKEVTLLFRDLLIGVTAFFRDAEAYDALAAEVFPRLLANKGPTQTVRVWVPGCATGEEVYSLAILLREHMDKLPSCPKVQIFGTDIDEAALSVARAARYLGDALEGLGVERLRRHFVEDGATYQLSKELRELCIFSTHSIVRDPPFSRMDLISCRNLLIYLDAELQNKVIPIFHYALRPGGFLFLGISENVSQNADLFAALDRQHRVFQRRDHAPMQPHLPLFLPGQRGFAARAEPRGDARNAAISLRDSVEGRILERFAPAHVVVNGDGDVVYYSIRTGKYLEASSGQPSRQLLGMARKGLRLDLRACVQEAAETGRTATRERVAIEMDDRVQLISLTVEPMAETEADPLFLVLFADLGAPLSAEDAIRVGLPFASDAPAGQLEADLRHTREKLQSTVEEYETALEELKAANEELVSMNEELQSTNEELETSKEEVQSVNEELQTVNQELGAKVEQLNQANADLQNLFESTQSAVIFLDRELRIRIFTPAVTSIFALIQTDRGRVVTDIAHNLDDDELDQQIRRVLTTGVPLETRVAKRDGSMHYLMRVLPYRAGGGLLDGALVIFIDLTAPVQTEKQLRLLVHELNHRARNLLTVVNALARQTAGRSGSVEQFVTGFVGRVNALARSHGLLARERWGDIALEELVRSEVMPHVPDGQGRIAVDGPMALLKPKAAVALGMIVHELAVNAVKHGALSVPNGKVAISWSTGARDGTRWLSLRWREQDGPPVAVPEHAGFGTTLIQRQAASELSGSAEFGYPVEGVSIRFLLPDDPELFVLSAEPSDG